VDEAFAQLRRHWKAAALVTAATAAAVTIPLTLLSQPSAGGGLVVPLGVPLTDTGATPPGWAPVAYGDAQISVPALWYDESSPGGSVCPGETGGMVFLGKVPDLPRFQRYGCVMKLNVVSIAPLRPKSACSGTVHKGTIKGFRVLRALEAHGFELLCVPQLHVRVLVRGPLASAVLNTLTWSPLSVALAPGPASTVPAGWRWHEFGGIRFAAPGGWNVERDNFWGYCGYPILPRVVRLSTATGLDASSCGGGPSFTVRSTAARPGVVVVGAGRYAPQMTSSERPRALLHCAGRHGMRVCVQDPGSSGPLLTLLVRPPGRAKPILVEIGLAGNGEIARAIYDSIRPG
jgi:hypothetical protein